jgi:NADP-dependent 3-hydroxy acid dehydrogenase YdfG
MVSLKIIQASNEALKDQPSGIIAVFAGATAGIGLGTLKAFVKHANAPKAYIIGRSKIKCSPILDELKALNPEATFVFLEAQIALITEVDRVCNLIKQKEERVDLLVMSPGYLTAARREGKLPYHPPTVLR